MGKYKALKDVVFNFSNEHVLTLQRGVLNYHEITIDMDQSDFKLIKALKILSKGKIYETTDKEIEKNLRTLKEMRFIEKVNELYKSNEILFLVNESTAQFKKFFPNFYQYIDIKDLITQPEEFIVIQDLNEKKTKFNNLINNFKLRNYKHLILVDSYYDVKRIRVINELVKFLNITGTFVVKDVDFFLLTTIKHGETGCFECLENQIKTRIKNIEFINNVNNRSIAPGPLLIYGFIDLILKELTKEGITNTLGNVIEMDTSSKEFFFDSNRIQTSCTVCATQSNIYHEEETIKTINILNNLLEEDNAD